MADKTITADEITADTKISINHVARDDISSVNIVETVNGRRRYTRIGAIYSKTKREYTAENSRLIASGTEEDDPAVAQLKQELSYFYTEVLYKEYRFFATRGLPASIIGFEVRQKHSDSKIRINAASLRARVKELEKN